MFSHLYNRLLSPIDPKVQYLVAGLFSVFLFGFILLYSHAMKPDLIVHIRLSEEMMDGKRTIGHPVFFFLEQMFSGFTKNPKLELYAAFLIFAMSQFAKIMVSLQLVEQIFKSKTNVLTFSLVVLAQLAIGNALIGQHYVITSLSPNYFHNGTLSLVIPFSLFFLTKSLQFLETGDVRIKRILILTGLVIVFTKPSFLFCWIPVMPFYALYRFGFDRKLLGILQVATLLSFVIIFQSLILKSSSLEFKLVFNPFYFFGTPLNHVLVVVAALSFPMVALVFYFPEFRNRPESLLFLGFLLQGLLLSFLFYDLINGIVSPNMNWQSSIAHYILLIFSIGIVDRGVQKRGIFPAVLPVLMLGLQVFSGLKHIYFSCLMRSFFN